MCMDPEFNCSDKIIMGMDINMTVDRDQVLEIERQIQVIKEQVRTIHGGLPYDCMKSRMVIEISKYVVIIQNDFPLNIGILQIYSSCTIMTGKHIDFKKKSRCPFGAYVQAHNSHNATNQMIDQNRGTI